MTMRVHVEQQDRMNIAPRRAEQLRSALANERMYGATRYTQAPTCSNPRCEGECALCSADASSTALVPDEAGDQFAKLGNAIVRAHKRAARTANVPAIVKRDGTVIRTASAARKQVLRTRIAGQAQRDAAEFRRSLDADEIRDRRVTVDPTTGDVIIPR